MPSNSVRIGERALERVVLAAQRWPRTARGLPSSTSRPPRSKSASAARPATRWSDARFFGAGLGEDQRAVREVERGEADLARQLRAPRLPVQPAGDHQVEDEEEVVVEREDDALAEPRDASDHLPLDRAERRRRRSHQKRADQPNAVDRLADDPRGKRFDVDRDVRQFRHDRIIVDCRIFARMVA